MEINKIKKKLSSLNWAKLTIMLSDTHSSIATYVVGSWGCLHVTDMDNRHENLGPVCDRTVECEYKVLTD